MENDKFNIDKILEEVNILDQDLLNWLRENEATIPLEFDTGFDENDLLEKE